MGLTEDEQEIYNLLCRDKMIKAQEKVVQLVTGLSQATYQGITKGPCAGLVQRQSNQIRRE